MTPNSIVSGKPTTKPSTEWIKAIHQEEALATSDHSVHAWDLWERPVLRKRSPGKQSKSPRKGKPWFVSDTEALLGG